jgi:hypothetical protein
MADAKKPATSKSASAQIHKVRALLDVPELSIARSALNLQIFARNEKIGELVIGRGALYWYGRNKRKAKRISWTKFAESMDELASSNVR